MCGRFAFVATTKDVEKVVPGAVKSNSIKNSYNIAPTSEVSGLMAKDEILELTSFKWGLIPSWAKDESIGNKMINARAETLEEKVSFKRLINKSRCVILATGFYEWMKTDSGKIPYFIKSKTDDLICFAGLYDIWTNPQGEKVISATILTTEPNELMAKIHNRMPVILSYKDIASWLRPLEKFDSLKPLLKPCDSENLKAYPVSKAVNNPRNNTETCMQSVGEEIML